MSGMRQLAGTKTMYRRDQTNYSLSAERNHAFHRAIAAAPCISSRQHATPLPRYCVVSAEDANDIRGGKTTERTSKIGPVPGFPVEGLIDQSEKQVNRFVHTIRISRKKNAGVDLATKTAIGHTRQSLYLKKAGSRGPGE